MIHVCFVLHDRTGRYSKFTGTTIFSIFENTSSKVTIHIFHDDTLTQENHDKFLELTKRYNQTLIFYNVARLCADKINTYVELVPSVEKTRVSKGAFYKFLIPQILGEDIEKIIYLDSDIIVNLDINELWQIELEDHPTAAVKNTFSPGVEPRKISGLLDHGFAEVEDYFNSGVMVMNLRVLRKEEENILSGIKFRGEHPTWSLWDQEIFNYLFSKRNLKLPAKFNILVKQTRSFEKFTITNEVYHYAGGKFGLGLDMNDPYNRLWWSYFIRTPWFNIDTLDKIIKGAAASILQPSAVPKNKARVFIIDEAHAYQIERNFSVREDEEVIIVDTESEDSFQQLIDLMNNTRHENVFFIGIPNVDLRLRGMRFLEGRDFFNVSSFYSPAWANLANNYDLILSM